MEELRGTGLMIVKIAAAECQRVNHAGVALWRALSALAPMAFFRQFCCALAHLIHTDWRSYIYYVPGTMCPHFGSCRQDRVSDRICEALEVDRRGFAGALAPRFSLGAG
jgi:hypothetical protein